MELFSSPVLYGTWCAASGGPAVVTPADDRQDVPLRLFPLAHHLLVRQTNHDVAQLRGVPIAYPVVSKLRGLVW